MTLTGRSLLHFMVVIAIIAIQASCTTQPAVPKAATAALVKIDNFAYSPKELGITVGTKVTWKNADDVPHTVTSRDDPQAFDSGALDTDESFSFTFIRPGRFSYYCKVHPHMTGVIVVK